MSLPCTLCATMVFFTETIIASSEMVQFANFMQRFNRSYESPEEFQYRLSVFSDNMKQANRLQREEIGTAEYGITKFSDLTGNYFSIMPPTPCRTVGCTLNNIKSAEEFKSYGLNSNIVLDLPILKEATTATPLPESRDWRTRGVISKVKNQGRCGSCWAFAVVGNIEAQWGIQGCPKNLSVQQVIDCGPCDNGCKGGYPWDAYITVLQQGGLVDEKEYKYETMRKECRKGLIPTAWIHDFQMLPKNETVMASYVGKNGTLTVTINSIALQHYVKGVIHTFHKNCDTEYVDHVVLIVGYVKGKHVPYWILKNSYGTDWGEKGYFKIFFGNNICGITKYPLTATVTFKKDKHSPCPP